MDQDLKELVRLIIIEEAQKINRNTIWDEQYNHTFLDDEAFKKESIYVPKKAKDKIKRWLKAMKLA